MRNRWLRHIAAGLVSAILATAAPPKLATKKVLTLEAARTIAAAAEEFARKNNWKVSIAILDDGAHLVYFQRMDGLQIGSIGVAMRKAESAAKFKRPGKAFADRVVNQPQVMTLPGAFACEGGLPITVEGEVIGSIGVSGDATAEQDVMIARAGLEALARMLRE